MALMNISLSEEYIWLIVGGLFVLLLFVFAFLLTANARSRNNPRTKNRLHDYVYYGIDRTIDSNRRYILMILVDSKKTKPAKIKLANIRYTFTVNLNKLVKKDKVKGNRFIDVLDSKVIVDTFPLYLVLEIMREDLMLLENQPSLLDKYQYELKNLVFYSNNLDEAKQFIENRK